MAKGTQGPILLLSRYFCSNASLSLKTALGGHSCAFVHDILTFWDLFKSYLTFKTQLQLHHIQGGFLPTGLPWTTWFPNRRAIVLCLTRH